MSEELGFSKGLAGVIADATAVSQVQGDVGRLIYRGIPIQELAQTSSFEECAFFALCGHLPTSVELANFRSDLAKSRVLPKCADAIIAAAPRSAHPMAVLQAVIASLGFEEDSPDLHNVMYNRSLAISIISKLATAVAAISRNRRGLSHISPDTQLGHAENFLYMMRGDLPSKEEARMFDVALLLHLDHDFNASTFAARVVASTEARLSLSISAAIGALSGPLHGGANEKVLAMADHIGEPSRARAWVLQALASKAKVSGFGHRVYRTVDPRAVVLHNMLESLVSQKGESKTYDILTIVHDTMIEELGKKEKDYIWPNVDFWSGALYRLMGIESIDFTPIFAVARVAGWCSHILEMWQDNRIYRPAAKYVGPTHSLYVPINERTL